MKNFLIRMSICLLTFLSSSQSAFSKIIYSKNSTNWKLTNTWVGDIVPTAQDTVVIFGHSVFISNTDNITVKRLVFKNNNSAESSLSLESFSKLIVLGDVEMSDDNFSQDVKFMARDSSSFQVDGDFIITRKATNSTTSPLRLHLLNGAEGLILGNLTYNYLEADFLEFSYELHLQGNSKLQVQGLTSFNIAGGNHFYARATDTSQLILNGGLIADMTDGANGYIESNSKALIKVAGDVTLRNASTESGAFGLRLFTGTDGGHVTVGGNFKLQSTDADAEVRLNSAVSSGFKTHITIGGNLIFDTPFESTAIVYLGDDVELFLAGDILRQQDLGSITMEEDAVLEFNGTAKQQIPATQIVSSEDSLYLTNLRFNNPAGFDIAGPMVIYDSLNLDMGIIKTTETNTLTIADGAKISEGNSTAYIDGPVTKLGSTKDESFLFPTGDQGKYAPIGITPKTTSTTSSYTAKYDKCPPPFEENLTGDLVEISGIQSWQITRGAMADSFDVTLHWMDANAEGIIDESSLMVAGLDAANEEWIPMGQNGMTTNGTSGYMTNDDKCPPPFERTVFTIGSIANNRLPSEIVRFEAKKEGEEVVINWTTATEINSAYFIVEKSKDGTNFGRLTSVDAHGNSTTLRNYSATDKNPLNGINYYRLQRVDMDGMVSPTEILTVNYRPTPEEPIIYPNPVQDFVQIEAKGLDGRDIILEVFNQNGQEVFSGNFTLDKNGISIPTSQLNIKNSGSYILFFHDSRTTHTMKFMKI